MTNVHGILFKFAALIRVTMMLYAISEKLIGVEVGCYRITIKLENEVELQVFSIILRKRHLIFFSLSLLLNVL